MKQLTVMKPETNEKCYNKINKQFMNKLLKGGINDILKKIRPENEHKKQPVKDL